MLLPRHVIEMLCIAAALVPAAQAGGQSYPDRPIRIVTSEPGGTGDFAARLITQRLAGSLGQPVIVDNRGGVIPMEIVAKAPPDGYTLLFYTTVLWILPLIQRASYDPVRDFLPITLAGSSPNILVVHPALPAKSVRELIDLAKSRPGQLNYSSGITGSSSHLAAELFKSMAGVNFIHVPYKSNGPALTGLLAGEAQIMFPSVAAVAPVIKSGKLRALAVTSAEPSVLAPGLPTVAASGLPGYETVSTMGIFAPARTPAAIIGRLNQEVALVLNRAEVKERILNIGAEAYTSTPEAFAARIKAEMASMGKLVKELGIRADQ